MTDIVLDVKSFVTLKSSTLILTMNLFELVRQGDLASLKTALATGVEPDPRNDYGETPLVVAAGQGATEIVDVLLDAGADINLANDFGFNALRSALWENHMALARQLAARGAEVSVECAAALGDVARLDRQWRTMTQIEDLIGAYLSACRTGRIDVVRWFLDLGMPVDLHPSGEEWGGIGCSGLHHAAVNGQTDVVQLLLERGSDVTLVDDVHGSQALAWAASAGKEAITTILLAAGSDPSHQNRHGLTAADLTRDNGFGELAERLEALEAGE